MFKQAEELLIAKAGKEGTIEFFEAYEKCLNKIGATVDVERLKKKIETLKSKTADKGH